MGPLVIFSALLQGFTGQKAVTERLCLALDQGQPKQSVLVTASHVIQWEDVGCQTEVWTVRRHFVIRILTFACDA